MRDRKAAVATATTAAPAILLFDATSAPARAQVPAPAAEPTATGDSSDASDGEDAGLRETGYELAGGYSNWVQYNGMRLELVVPIGSRMRGRRTQGYGEVGTYIGNITIYGRIARRALYAFGFGVQAKSASGRTYALVGAGLYHTVFAIPREFQDSEDLLGRRTGVGFRGGVGYLPGGSAFIELTAAALPVPPGVPGARRTVLEVGLGKRF